jgi:hypothetical protein
MFQNSGIFGRKVLKCLMSSLQPEFSDETLVYAGARYRRKLRLKDRSTRLFSCPSPIIEKTPDEPDEPDGEIRYKARRHGDCDRFNRFNRFNLRKDKAN